MDIKDLIKAIDPEGILDKDQVAEVVKNAEESIADKVKNARDEGKAEGKKEAKDEAFKEIEEAKKCAYESAVSATLKETEELIKTAEKTGFEAGVTEALKQAESLAEEYDTQVQEAVKELAEAYDQYVDINTVKKIKETEEEVTDRVVESLDKYLVTYVKEVIPESVVIDYDRIQKLEKTFQVLKESLIITDADVQAKIKQLDESSAIELTKSREALKAEVQKRIVAESKMCDQEATILLNEKIVDLPIYEKNILKKKFSGKSVKEINESFDTELGRIHDELISETEKSKVVETVINESEIKEKLPKKEEVVTESKNTPTANIQMARYAELAGRHSNFTAR